MEKLRKRCDSLDKEIKDQWKFKEFYQFTFTFAKNPGQKGLGRQYFNNSSIHFAVYTYMYIHVLCSAHACTCTCHVHVHVMSCTCTCTCK